MRKKKAAGFTLVELIVVIAVMGILGAVGTVAYSGYVKSAQKKADMVTVGNIERAIDVGAYAYNVDTLLQLAGDGMKIPVGFILITKDNVESLESATPVETNSSTCHLTTAEFPVLVSYTYGSGCDESTAYVQSGTESITYCETHSRVVEKSMPIGTNTSDTNPRYVMTKVKNESVIITNHTEGQETSTQQYGVYVDTNSGVLDQVMRAAYGNSYRNDVRLQSSEWNVSSIPAFYAGTEGLWDEMSDLAHQFADNSGLLRSYIADDHDSAAALVMDYATKLTTEQNEERFITNWVNIANSPDSGNQHTASSFGLAGREYYCAARKSFNACFASYLKSKGHTADHIDAINNYTKMGALPQCICRSAFKDSNLSPSVRDCAECKAYFEEWVSSGACETDGRAYYNTMVTLAQTDPQILQMDKENTLDFFDFYESYLQQVSGLYTTVQEKTKNEDSCIVISVYSEGDRLYYDVSPTEANPNLK